MSVASRKRAAKRIKLRYGNPKRRPEDEKIKTLRKKS